MTPGLSGRFLLGVFGKRTRKEAVIPAKAGIQARNVLGTLKAATISPSFQRKLESILLSARSSEATATARWIPAFAGMTEVRFDGLMAWIPAFAGMTKRGVTA